MPETDAVDTIDPETVPLAVSPTCLSDEVRELIRLNTQVCVTVMEMITGNPMMASVIPAEVIEDAKRITVRMKELYPHV